MKEIVSHDAPKKIKHIQFSVLSQQDIVQISELECVTRELYRVGEAEKTPMKGGVLDRRLVSGRLRGLTSHHTHIR